MYRRRRGHRGRRLPRARRRRQHPLCPRPGRLGHRRAQPRRHCLGGHASRSRLRVPYRRTSEPRQRSMRQHTFGERLLVVLAGASRWRVVLQQPRRRQPHAATRHGRGMVVRAEPGDHRDPSSPPRPSAALAGCRTGATRPGRLQHAGLVGDHDEQYSGPDIVGDDSVDDPEPAGGRRRHPASTNRGAGRAAASGRATSRRPLSATTRMAAGRPATARREAMGRQRTPRRARSM